MKQINKSKRIAILQSSYIPWKGYFDLIRSVDEFIVYDDVQYTKRNWRNRNLIKTPYGLHWLTIPVKVKGRYKQLIKNVEVATSKWAEKHWKSIQICYKKSKYFSKYEQIFREAYKDVSELKMLSDINLYYIKLINNLLGINTLITFSENYNEAGKGDNRILRLCLKAGASEYITGPSALNYIDRSKFEKENIKLKIADYSGYPEYNQSWPPFSHNVSIIDLIFNEGRNAINFMKIFD